jgi:glycerophosphoryl diester phosphodiesterase
MILSRRAPLICAHRGASAHAPENTIASFELAIQQRADVIELDAKLTGDEHVVVIHDSTVDRTTNGTGLVGDFSLTELKELDASHHFSPKFKGEPVPTLDEVLETIGTRTLINIELTNYRTPFDSLPVKVAQLVKHHGLENNLLVSSFNPITLRRFHPLSPSIPIGLLVKPGLIGNLTGSILGNLMISYQSFHPEKSLVTQDLIKKSHSKGCRVYSFTINTVSEIKRLLTLKVDGIITDDPESARLVIDTTKSTVNDN